MAHLRILVGAIVVIALLLVAPLLGLIALAACVVVALILWIFGNGDSRACPVCGEPVKNGVTVCGSCGHDFRAAAERELAGRRDQAVGGLAPRQDRQDDADDL